LHNGHGTGMTLSYAGALAELGAAARRVGRSDLSLPRRDSPRRLAPRLDKAERAFLT